MNILTIVAHPDDEVIGAGGSLARHAASGDDVRVLFMADGVSSRIGTHPEDRETRKAHARACCSKLGVRILGHGTFPDNQFDSVPVLQLAQFIESLKSEFYPDIIYTHFAGDLNVDHRATFQAVLTAYRPQPHERYQEIRCFEVSSSTEWSHPSLHTPFTPNLYIDIEAHLDTKLTAYQCYQDEVRDFPHSRSVQALQSRAGCRGSEVGLMAAEAFLTIRRIIRENTLR